MSYKYVNKCDCCETRFSNIKINGICVAHKDELIYKLRDELKTMGAKGEVTLIGNEELITCVYYKYKEKEEWEKGDYICERLFNAAEEFSIEKNTNGLVYYYSEN